MPESSAPRASDPVSPMNILAGCRLKKKAEQRAEPTAQDRSPRHRQRDGDDRDHGQRRDHRSGREPVETIGEVDRVDRRR